MVTVISPTKTGTNAAKPKGGARAPRSGGSGGGSGGGDDRRRRGGGDFPLPERDPSPSRSRVMLGVLFAGIVMMFLSLTIAYLSLAGAKGWQPIDLPASLWSSTALILVSSLTFERARRAWRGATAGSAGFQRSAASDEQTDAQCALLRRAQSWLLATFLLGVGFVLSQVLVWRELVGQNLYLTTDRHSSFFYMLTGLHALHIVGGIAVLGYLLLRVRARRRQVEIERDVLSASLVSLEERAAPPEPLAPHTIDAGAIYWHFVDGLWVYVLLLLLWG